MAEVTRDLLVDDLELLVKDMEEFFGTLPLDLRATLTEINNYILDTEIKRPEPKG